MGVEVLQETERFNLHHIGWAVESIERAVLEFQMMGYRLIKMCDDESRNVRLALLGLEEGNCGDYLIELVEPLQSGSPVDSVVRRGGGVYHVCFEVDDIQKSVEMLVSRGYILVESPREAELFEGRKVAFLWKNGIGLVELLEK